MGAIEIFLAIYVTAIITNDKKLITICKELLEEVLKIYTENKISFAMHYIFNTEKAR